MTDFAVTIEPRAEVYIDEFSSTLSEDIDEEFKDGLIGLVSFRLWKLIGFAWNRWDRRQFVG